jgi:hypothetical protein
VVLAASAAALIVLVSACKKSLVLPTNQRPILIIMDAGGVKTSKPPDIVKTECKKLNDAAGKTVCEVKVYDNSGREVVDNRSLTMTGAVRSETAANPVAPDPINVTQKAAFATFDDAKDFLNNIK